MGGAAAATLACVSPGYVIVGMVLSACSGAHTWQELNQSAPGLSVSAHGKRDIVQTAQHSTPYHCYPVGAHVHVCWRG